MKNKAPFYIAVLLFMVSVFNLSGCSKLSGPSDEDVIKAITASGIFKGGFGELTLTKPVVSLEKKGRNKDGAWPVKVKVTFTVYVKKDQISAPMEKTIMINMIKGKDAAGNSAWKAVAGQ